MRLRKLPALVYSAILILNVTGFASNNQRWEKAMQAESTAYQECDFGKAVAYLKKATIAARKFHFSDPRLVETLNRWGDLFRAGRQFQRSKWAYNQALVWGGVWLKPNDPAVADTLVGLGLVSQETHQGDYSRAESYFNEALAIQEEVLGPNSLEVAFTLNCLGELDMIRHKDAPAESLFHRVLEIRRKKLKPDDPALAQTLEDLALVYEHEGKLNKADTLFQEALVIYKKSLAPDNCELALVYRNYASLLTKLGRIAEASELEAESFRIAKKQLQK